MKDKYPEFLRKFLHILPIFIVPIFQLFSKHDILAYGFLLLLFSLFLEFLRFKYDFLSIIARPHEKGRFASHIYLLSSILLVIFFFPEEIAVIGIVMAVIGDAFAALIGKSFGKIRLRQRKTLEGVFAGIFFAMLAGSLLTLIYSLSLPLVIFASLFVSLPDIIDLRINDNLLLPLIIPLVLFISSTV